MSENGKVEIEGKCRKRMEEEKQREEKIKRQKGNKRKRKGNTV